MSTNAPYYQNVNPDLLARVPLNARHILEVGCGNGNFARAVLARQPQAAYVGVELFAQAAQEAQGVLSQIERQASGFSPRFERSGRDGLLSFV